MYFAGFITQADHKGIKMRLTVRSGVSVPGLTVRELAHGMEVTEQKEGRSPAHHVLLCKIARGAGQGKKPLGLIPTGLSRLK